MTHRWLAVPTIMALPLIGSIGSRPQLISVTVSHEHSKADIRAAAHGARQKRARDQYADAGAMDRNRGRQVIVRRGFMPHI